MTLESAFQKFKEKDIQEARKKLDALDGIEHQADEIRRSILLEITNSEIDESTKEVLAHLVKNIDRIANTANGAGRIFYKLPGQYFEILFRNETLMGMIKTSVQAVKLIDKMVTDLLAGKNIDELNQTIQVLEHEVDIGLSKMYEYFLGLPDQIPPFVAIQLAKGIDYIEAITDSIEDVADYIKVLTIRKD